MWVIKRKSDGKYRAKIFTGSSHTYSLRLAEKFDCRLEASSHCGADEFAIEVNPVDYFKRG